MTEEEHKPLWLTSKIDQRLALMQDKGGLAIAASGAQVVMTPLTEPEELGLSPEDWERTCDNCRTTVAVGEIFYTGNYTDQLPSGQWAILTFGMCPPCKDLP